MDQMNRRDALMGLAAAGIAGSVGRPLMASTQLQQTGLAPIGPRARTLTVIEQPADELAEMERLQREVNAAYAHTNELAQKMQSYEQGLREKYRCQVCSAVKVNDTAIDVSFEQGYVFVRDYRAQIAEKEAAMQQCGAQLKPQDYDSRMLG